MATSQAWSMQARQTPWEVSVLSIPLSEEVFLKSWIWTWVVVILKSQWLIPQQLRWQESQESISNRWVESSSNNINNLSHYTNTNNNNNNSKCNKCNRVIKREEIDLHSSWSRMEVLTGVHHQVFLMTWETVHCCPWILEITNEHSDQFYNALLFFVISNKKFHFQPKCKFLYG
jgi:hypothetical protein